MKILRAFLFVAALAVIARAQQNEKHLIFTGEVIQIQEATLDEGVADAYHMVDYEILKVCKGDLQGDTIRIAHHIGTAKDLKPGNVVCLQIRTTDGFREVAKILFEYDGILVPEESISDYIFEGFGETDSCQAL